MLYLVGGSVRDLLLGRPVRDLDFAFSGGPAELVQALPSARKVGKTVNVWLQGGLEISPLRGGTLASDLAARDLTINALAVDENGRLHAHPQALADLRSGLLRAAAPGAFEADPARVFRVARLAAELPDFTVEEGTLALMRDMSGTPALAHVPAERVCREALLALAAPRPSRLLSVLEAGGCLAPWLEELDATSRIPAGPARWHDNSVLEHTGEVMDRCAGNPVAAWMALCHDLGKKETDPALLPHHYGHELRSEAAARRLGARLGMPSRFIAAGALGAALHMKAGKYASLRAGTRRDLLWRVHTAGLHDPFWKMAESDSGKPLRRMADADLARILAVRLPESWRDRGRDSGSHLRDLQCQALGGP